MSNGVQSVRVAVVTGGHSFDVVSFHGLFRGLEGVDAYVQHMDDWASSSGEVRDGYDAVVFYNFQMETPPEKGLPWYCGNPRGAVENLGATPQGILMLHHAILAYPEWPVWSEMVGIEGRDFGYHLNQSVKVEVVDAAHPITEELTSWEMLDETYTMAEPAAGSRVLLSIDHPKSMKSVAWTREHRSSRVFCLQCGHDNAAWCDASFMRVLRQGILWCARRI